jgi:hypothetical protein
MQPFMEIRGLTPQLGRLKCVWVPGADGRLESIWVPDWEQDATWTEPVRKAS